MHVHFQKMQIRKVTAFSQFYDTFLACNFFPSIEHFQDLKNFDIYFNILNIKITSLCLV